MSETKARRTGTDATPWCGWPGAGRCRSTRSIDRVDAERDSRVLVEAMAELAEIDGEVLELVRNGIAKSRQLDT